MQINPFFPLAVSPAKRSDYGLMTINGLQHTLFAETSLSQAEFNAISQVDATPSEKSTSFAYFMASAAI